MLKKLISAVVLVCFTTTTILLDARGLSFAASQPAGSVEQTLPPSTLSLPPNIGSVEEYFEGENDQVVYYIQDAHTSLEAQENIAKIIHFFSSGGGSRKSFCGRL